MQPLPKGELQAKDLASALTYDHAATTTVTASTGIVAAVFLMLPSNPTAMKGFTGSGNVKE